MELTDLPSELIPQYALGLDLFSINHLCSVSREFNKRVCQSEYFCGSGAPPESFHDSGR